jgi:secondary thiamine-phosphate synthase enzyme
MRVEKRSWKMPIHQERITVSTPGRGFVDITDELAEVVARASVGAGLCQLFLQHTSASLLIQENADPAVLRDLQRWIDQVAPESADYEHSAEGPDDMPAHLRAAITRTSETIPVADGRLQLGTWQAVYVWEHRRLPHQRTVLVTVLE